MLTENQESLPVMLGFTTLTLLDWLGHAFKGIIAEWLISKSPSLYKRGDVPDDSASAALIHCRICLDNAECTIGLENVVAGTVQWLLSPGLCCCHSLRDRGELLLYALCPKTFCSAWGLAPYAGQVSLGLKIVFLGGVRFTERKALKPNWTSYSYWCVSNMRPFVHILMFLGKRVCQLVREYYYSALPLYRFCCFSVGNLNSLDNILSSSVYVKG